MHNIKKIDHIGIRVTRFEKMVQFYQQLGFKLVRQDDKESVAVLKHSNGIEVNLIKNAGDAQPGQNILMDVPQKYPGYTHFALQVDSLTRVKKELELMNINITEGPVTFGDGKTSIFIRDPEWNVIEFTELP